MTTPAEEPCKSPKLHAHKFGAFVILDLETSGIPELTFNKVSILELCMYGFPISEMQKRCMKYADNNENYGKAEAEENTKENDVKIDEILTPTLHHRHNQNVCEVPPTPRTLTKLSLVMNPNCCVFKEVTDLTGLDNYMLEDFGRFNENIGSMLINFIKLLPQPVCLVAHNGKFDFPILKATLTKYNVELPEDVMCLDSLRAFVEIDQENCSQQAKKAVEILENSISENSYEKEGEAQRKRNENTPKRSIIVQESKVNNKHARTENGDCIPQECPATPKSSMNKGVFKSRRALFHDDKNINENMALNRLMGKFFPPKNVYKLGNIYERVHGPITNQLHRAETDVDLLMRLVLHYGEDFLNYAQTWAVPFSAIPTSVISSN